MTLRQIATSTKISMVALEALERDDFSRLPGGIFSRAFVRAYALEVGLEPDPTVATFIEEYDKAVSMRAERIIRPEVTADDREFLARQHRAARILRWVLIGLALIAVAALVLWQVRARSSFGAASSTSAPVAESAPVVIPPPPAAQNPVPGAAQMQTPGGAAGAAGSAAAPVAPPSTGQTVPADPDQVVLHVDVTDNCWTG